MEGGGILSNLNGIFFKTWKLSGNEKEMYSFLLKMENLKKGINPNPSKSSLHSENKMSVSWKEVELNSNGF